MAVAYMGHAVGGPAAGKWFRSFTRDLVISERAKDLSLQLAPAEVKKGSAGFVIHITMSKSPATMVSGSTRACDNLRSISVFF